MAASRLASGFLYTAQRCVGLVSAGRREEMLQDCKAKAVKGSVGGRNDSKVVEPGI